ncbi:MAG: bifunctional adenosylcobinamide kinase/adenosylcobinamide-phosphate guanylyltransferase [Emcibacter sp.]|nr:bifunctional adenosylcobinamide kinase/adenosylcobinamide-phosphate guanylyltransferase [Emcibacter sp.]
MNKKSQLKGVSLIIGGARSGKSRYGESLALTLHKTPLYIATAEIHDTEMQQRIDLHKESRDQAWTICEEPIDIAAVIADHALPDHTILLDCLTLWLSNLMGRNMDIDKEITSLCQILEKYPGNIILISNEVGQGIVPNNALARQFRDHAGRLNQAIAQIADNVIHMVAGLPMIAKKNSIATFGEYM